MQIKPVILKTERVNEELFSPDTVQLNIVAGVYMVLVYDEWHELNPIYSTDKEWAEGLYEDFVKHGYFETLKSRGLDLE
jgi:hypothetical protein